MMLEMSLSEAQALTLSAQGLDSAHQHSPALKSTMDVVDRLGLLQIDSVNVFERAHFMPVFSRVGRFDKGDLESLMGAGDATEGRAGGLIEYWCHEASLIRTENLPLYKWRMDAARDREYNKSGRVGWAEQNRELVDWTLAEIRDKGPMTSAAIEHDRNVRQDKWWGWSDTKRALEYLFLVGDVVSAGREKFSRMYGTPEQVLPKDVLERMNTQDPHQAKLVLLRQAARAFGVGTAKDLGDYHRFRGDLKPMLNELVADGSLTEESVEGWEHQAYAFTAALEWKFDAPERTSVLSPFDPLVWFRDRAERLFGFEYRIEIYTPEPKRIYGYYTLPVLHRGRVVGRIDLKSDRQSGVLMVQSAWHELWMKASEVKVLAGDLAAHLREVRDWQGLGSIKIAEKGNLAPALLKQKL
jgi:uncharacterized protein YcaQ